MKYKLIKEWPNGPELGSIFIPINLTCEDNTGYGTFSIYSFFEKTIKQFPEFFAPHLFISDDNVDIYEGDLTYKVEKNSKSYDQTPYKHLSRDDGSKYFSTKEAANKYLTAQYNWKPGDIVKIVNTFVMDIAENSLAIVKNFPEMIEHISTPVVNVQWLSPKIGKHGGTSAQQDGEYECSRFVKIDSLAERIERLEKEIKELKTTCC